MLTRKRFMKVFMLLMVLSLVIVACDRPLPSADNDNETTQTNDNENPYPVATQDTAVGGNTATDPVEPSEGEVPAEATPEAAAETGEETGEGDPGEGEVPAEATPETQAVEGQEEGEGEASEGEVPAEVDGEPTGSEEGQTETGEGSGEPSEVEVPAETTDPSTTEEGVSETSDPAPSEVEVSAEAEGETVEAVLPATHTVAAGENLYRIGLQYGISWVAIADANDITNPDRIFAGQILDIPGGGQQGSGGQPEPMPTPEGINYVVKPGDTLFKIAQQFNISWVEIAEANGLVNPNQIYAGQMIKIPVDAPAPTVHHVVQPGETLFRISLHYGVSWLAIAHANRIGPPYHIYAGQTLIIPGGH